MKRYGIFIFLFIVSLSLGLLQAQTYVGPERCLKCHNNPGLGDMTGWRTSLHANGYSHVPDDAHSLEDLYGIVADGNQNQVDDFKDGLNFNDIESAFDQYKPDAPILGYSVENGYTITIGQVTHTVYLTYGGSGLYKQRYMLKINTSQGESAALYISPVQYNEKTHEYVLYHPDDWYDTNNDPIYTPSSMLADVAANSRNMPKQCSGCHVTGLELTQDVNGEWIASGATVEDEDDYLLYNNIFDLDGDGNLDQINTGCERCHGPGGDHVQGPSTENIINPDSLTAEEANNICGMCHSRGKSLSNNTFSFPFDDDNLLSWTVGDLVVDFYTDGGGYWSDDKNSSSHHQQFYDFIKSSKPTYQWHNVRCSECHDVHNEVTHHIREEIVEEDSTGVDITVATDNDNNTLCLACHATHGDFSDIPVEWVADYVTYENDIGTVVSAHTNHSYDPEGTGASRCSKCHNPKIAKSAIHYDIHSHTFEPIPPQKTKLNEMPNACAVSCHMKGGVYPDFGIDFSGDDISDWTEATDLALADTLMYYYGPGGIWWDLDVTSITGSFVTLPKNYTLSQNYPNPFNPTTKIDFRLAKAGKVTIEIFNIIGQKVAVLVDGYKKAGKYTVEFNAVGLASGMYFYRMTSREFVVTNKMLVMK